MRPAPLASPRRPRSHRRSPVPRNLHGRGSFSNPTNGSAPRRAALWEGGRVAAAKGPTGSVVLAGRESGAGAGFLSGGGWAALWERAARGCLPRLLYCTHPEPPGPVPSAASGPRLPREGALASPGLPRGLPSPARLAVCSARALPSSGLAERYICKFQLVDTPGDCSDAISTGVLWAERQAEALQAVYKQDNHYFQVVKGKRPGNLLKPQMPYIRAGISRIGKLWF